MTSRAKKLVGAAIALGLALASSPLVIRVARRPKERFPYSRGALSSADYDALVADGRWSKSLAPVAPNVSLNGVIRRPRAADAPWIVFYPGNDDTQLKTAKRFLDRVIADKDWGAAVYAYRGYDSSPGAPDLDAYRADAPAILEGVIDREKLDRKRVHVVAFSTGTWFAPIAVGAAARAGKPVASMTLLAALHRMELVHPGRFAGYAFGDLFETEASLADVPAPVLIIVGGADEALGAWQSRKVAATLGARARLLELPGFGHVTLMDHAEVSDAVRDFIVSTS